MAASQNHQTFQQIPPQFRGDLVSLLGETLCKSTRPLQLDQLWTIGVYDLHLNIQHIRAKKGFAINSKQLAKAAYNEALKHDAGGFAYQQCNAHKAWIMHLPSPSKTFTMHQSKLQIDASDLNRNCRFFRLDFAPFLTPKTKLLFHSKNYQVVKHIDINTKLLNVGTIGLSCYPFDENKGPVEWTMIPVNEDNNKLYKSSESIISPVSNDMEDFKRWINDIRVLAGLPMLGFQNQHLENAARQLSINHPKVTHYRPILAKIKTYLGLKNLNFIGENRVIANEPSEFARLFWLSPRHRSLLLSPSAKYAAFYPLKKGQQTLLVLILAGEMPAHKGLSRAL